MKFISRTLFSFTITNALDFPLTENHFAIFIHTNNNY